MTSIFADTSYWLALLLPRDRLHNRARLAATEFLQEARIVTSEFVIVEVLNFLHAHSFDSRKKAYSIFQLSEMVEIVPSSKSLFENAGKRYLKADDKEWSFTDCTSFEIMEQRNIRDALTADHHFEQAGFRVLLK